MSQVRFLQGQALFHAHEGGYLQIPGMEGASTLGSASFLPSGNRKPLSGSV